MDATDEKKPARGGLADEMQRELEAAAAEMARRARHAYRTAECEPEGSYGRRFIEHGAACYFNCWARLQKILDASSLLPSGTPAED